MAESPVCAAGVVISDRPQCASVQERLEKKKEQENGLDFCRCVGLGGGQQALDRYTHKGGVTVTRAEGLPVVPANLILSEADPGIYHIPPTPREPQIGDLKRWAHGGGNEGLLSKILQYTF